MSLYLDASVVVPILVPEPASGRVQAWFSQVREPLVVSDLTAGESASALSRLVRMARLSAEEAAAALGDLEQWLRGVDRVEHVGADVRRAGALVRTPTPKLLMPDAIHLATCSRLGVALVTLDEDLARHAERLGIRPVRP